MTLFIKNRVVASALLSIVLANGTIEAAMAGSPSTIQRQPAEDLRQHPVFTMILPLLVVMGVIQFAIIGAESHQQNTATLKAELMALKRALLEAEALDQFLAEAQAGRPRTSAGDLDAQALHRRLKQIFPEGFTAIPEWIRHFRIDAEKRGTTRLYWGPRGMNQGLDQFLVELEEKLQGLARLSLANSLSPEEARLLIQKVEGLGTPLHGKYPKLTEGMLLATQEPQMIS